PALPAWGARSRRRRDRYTGSTRDVMVATAAAVSDFFFQAEDGIRGPLVTGVQTCALPISLPRSAPQTPPTSGPGQGADTGTPRRSEERRVGKEWRYRGARSQKNKKMPTKTGPHRLYSRTTDRRKSHTHAVRTHDAM